MDTLSFGKEQLSPEPTNQTKDLLRIVGRESIRSASSVSEQTCGPSGHPSVGSAASQVVDFGQKLHVRRAFDA
ncbi:MAG: hypothetical protein WCF48_04440, partial [Terriglobales bacterium]